MSCLYLHLTHALQNDHMPTSKEVVHEQLRESCTRELNITKDTSIHKTAFMQFITSSFKGGNMKGHNSCLVRRLITSWRHGKSWCTRYHLPLLNKRVSQIKICTSMNLHTYIHLSLCLFFGNNDKHKSCQSYKQLAQQWVNHAKHFMDCIRTSDLIKYCRWIMIK